MKKILLGTTALVAAGLVAGPALASDPLKVTVGGNVVTGFYVVDADNAGATKFASTKVAVVARNIDVIAEGTLDNGMTAGVDAKLMLGSDFSNATNLNANTNGFATFRQLYAYLEGGFGRFEIGGTDGAAYKMHYTSPWFVPGNGVDTPNIYNSALSPVRASTFSLLATDSNKVSYFTPRLAGFQLGVSYTPDAGTNFSGGRNVTANGHGLLVQGAASATEVYEVAGNYSGSFSGVDLGVDAFYTAGNSGASNTNPTEYGFGTNIGFQGFTLGGAYYKSDDIAGSYTPAAGRASKVWTVGLDYATGPWTVGVAYLNGKEDSSTVLAAAAAKKNSTWQVGGGYSLGSGVDVGLDLQLNSVDTYSLGSYDSKSAGLVLAVSF